MRSSLEQKTVRPGSLNDFSFYYSSRQLPRTAAPVRRPSVKKDRSHTRLIVAVVIVVAAAAFLLPSLHKSNATPVAATKQTVSPTPTKKAAVVATAPVNHCSGNTADHFIKVDISDRHLWACQGTKMVYDTPVITGMEKHAATETPVGTYKIYAKQADTVLTGSDETGSWRDPVSYWMPFLNNQYGTYGFHDATWRQPSEFGKIDPYTSDNASHGCVELPIAASQWLYSWAQVGTTLTIES